VELSLYGLERMRIARQVGRPIGPDDEQTRGVAPSGDHREQIDGAGVAPVQILQDEHERCFDGEGVERLDQLTEHALARRRLSAPPHRFQILVGEERGQLREPGGCVLLQDPHERVLRTLSPHAPKRLQHRQIRLAGAVLLDALPAADAEPVRIAELGEERLHQGGLADPRLAGDEHDLSPAVGRRREDLVQSRELAIAADQRHGRGAARDAGSARRSRARPTDRADESKPPPMDRLDVARRARGIIEGLAQIADAARERGFADDGVAPGHGEKLVLRDQVLGMLDQMAEHRERLRGELEAILAAPRPSGVRLDADRGHVVGSDLPHGARHVTSPWRCTRRYDSSRAGACPRSPPSCSTPLRNRDVESRDQ
jgi:hypothetical protein